MLFLISDRLGEGRRCRKQPYERRNTFSHPRAFIASFRYLKLKLAAAGCFRGRIDQTCGFENFLPLSTGPPSRPGCPPPNPFSGLPPHSMSPPTLSPYT